MTDSNSSLLRQAILAALRTSDIADIAGIDRDEWAGLPDEGGHVFEGTESFIGARNRGRLPFIVVNLPSHRETMQVTDGGMISATLEGEIHVGGNDRDLAEDSARELSFIARRRIRSLPAGRYTFIGTDEEGGFTSSALGHMLPFRMTFEQTLTRAP